MKVLQVSPTYGEACGIGNFSAALQEQADDLGLFFQTERDFQKYDNGFDLVLLHHEHSFFPVERLRSKLVRIDAPVVMFLHSPSDGCLESLADGFVCMNKGMVSTDKPFLETYIPGYVPLHLSDRRSVKRELGLSSFDAVVGTSCFVSPRRELSRMVSILGATFKYNNWCLFLNTPRHYRHSRQVGLQRAYNSLRRAAAKFGRNVKIDAKFRSQDERCRRLQACDLLWCFTSVPPKQYASSACSDLYGTGVRLIVSKLPQHESVLELDNAVTTSRGIEGFCKELVNQVSTGNFPRHDPLPIGWTSWFPSFYKFLLEMRNATPAVPVHADTYRHDLH